MLGLTSFASILTIVGGLSIQMNAYLADAKSSAPTRETVSIAATAPASLADHIKEYFADEPILADIAACESGNRQFDSNGRVIRGEANPDDVGIMQINEKYHLEQAKSLGYDIYSIEGNMAFGRYLYETEGTQPWSASKACWEAIARKAGLALK